MRRPCALTARSIAAKRGIAASRRATSRRATWRPSRNAAVDPSVAPISAYATPRQQPNTAPPAMVSSDAGISATTASA